MLIEEVVQCAGLMSAQCLISSDKSLTEMFSINLDATRMLVEAIHFAIVTTFPGFADLVISTNNVTKTGLWKNITHVDSHTLKWKVISFHFNSVKQMHRREIWSFSQLRPLPDVS